MELKNVEWRKDEFGDYWIADLLENGKKVGIMGNYYDLDKDGRQANKEEIILPY